MEVEYSKDFIRDINGIRDKRLQKKITRVVDLLKDTDRLDNVSNIKKLKGSSKHFRIRIGDYRLGFVSENKRLILSRFLNRKEIYRYFP